MYTIFSLKELNQLTRHKWNEKAEGVKIQNKNCYGVVPIHLLCQ